MKQGWTADDDDDMDALAESISKKQNVVSTAQAKVMLTTDKNQTAKEKAPASNVQVNEDTSLL